MSLAQWLIGMFARFDLSLIVTLLGVCIHYYDWGNIVLLQGVIRLASNGILGNITSL